MASSTRSVLLLVTLLATLSYFAMAAPAVADIALSSTVTSGASFATPTVAAASTATSGYDMEGLPASIFPVLTAYPDEYESTTELDDGHLYMSEQDAGTKF